MIKGLLWKTFKSIIGKGTKSEIKSIEFENVDVTDY